MRRWLDGTWRRQDFEALQEARKSTRFSEKKVVSESNAAPIRDSLSGLAFGCCLMLWSDTRPFSPSSLPYIPSAAPTPAMARAPGGLGGSTGNSAGGTTAGASGRGPTQLWSFPRSGRRWQPAGALRHKPKPGAAGPCGRLVEIRGGGGGPGSFSGLATVTVVNGDRHGDTGL